MHRLSILSSKTRWWVSLKTLPLYEPNTCTLATWRHLVHLLLLSIEIFLYQVLSLTLEHNLLNIFETAKRKFTVHLLHEPCFLSSGRNRGSAQEGGAVGLVAMGGSRFRNKGGLKFMNKFLTKSIYFLDNFKKKKKNCSQVHYFFLLIPNKTTYINILNIITINKFYKTVE